MAETAQRQGAPGAGGRCRGRPRPGPPPRRPTPDTSPCTRRRDGGRRASRQERAAHDPPLHRRQARRTRRPAALPTATSAPASRTLAAEHGYKGESGFAADIVLAFLTGRFTANLPLSEDRRRTHVFRAQVLRQLNRIGVNINQIARALNSDLTPPDIRHRLDELHHLLDLIAAALRQPAEPDEEACRVIAAIKPAGTNTRGLLAYLYGPGRHDEHLDPHLVAAFAMLGMPDPGRDENATLTELARHLDAPVRLRNSEFGKTVTDHVWHCPVRAAPEDRYLSDAEWGEIAQRIVAAAGIAPEGDDLGCRWIAVRHADDHIHILATTVREDGRRPKLHDSGLRVGDACRQIEKDYGLRRLKKGDRTGTRRPTQAEMHKAARLGWKQTSKDWLQDRIRAAIPHAANAEELLVLPRSRRRRDQAPARSFRRPPRLRRRPPRRPQQGRRTDLPPRRQDRPRPDPAQTAGPPGERHPRGAPHRPP